MYASLRCRARPSCRIAVHTNHQRTIAIRRHLHSSCSLQNATPSSDPEKKEDDAGDKDKLKETEDEESKATGGNSGSAGRWNRRGMVSERRRLRSSNYVFVDAEEAGLTSSHGRKFNSKALSPLRLPPWFQDRYVLRFDEASRIAANATSTFIRVPEHDQAVTFNPPNEGSSEPPKVPEPSAVVFKYNAATGPSEAEDIAGKDRFVELDRGLYTEVEGIFRTGLAAPPHNIKESALSIRSAVSLHCPVDGSVTFLSSLVDSVARSLKARVLKLNAQDLAELGGAYVCPEAELDSSLRTLGFDIYEEPNEEETAEDGQIAEEEEDEDDHNDPNATSRPKPLVLFQNLGTLQPNFGDVLKRLTGAKMPSSGNKKLDARDANSRNKIDEDGIEEVVLDERRLEKFLNSVINAAWADKVTDNAVDASKQPKLIICIEEFMQITNTPVGKEMAEKLADIIRRRRAEKGERIMLVGVSADADVLETNDPEKTIQWRTEGTIWRTDIITPQSEDGIVMTSQSPIFQEATQTRNVRINHQNLSAILAAMAPSTYPTGLQLSKDDLSTLSKVREPTNIKLGVINGFSQFVLTQDEIHRVATALLALKLADRGSDTSDLRQLIHALNMCHTVDLKRHAGLSELRRRDLWKLSKPGSAFGMPFRGISNIFSAHSPPMAGGSLVMPGAAEKDSRNMGTKDVSARLQALQQQADRYEKKLIGGVVLPERINTTFADVHVGKETTDAVRDLTALSLQRPDAFKYGVLATNTLSGLLLYGPPGTGKTMLAKAVAKESQAAVLTITGSDVNQMWVGESEKTVKAIFSLARKLAPCIVFIDEADALLASRGTEGRNRPTHRDTINQFLLEWDGMNEMGVFLMVATNRPFDLDDAVLRRLPRRVLVDLPTKEDREAILRIHLKGETLHDEVDVAQLATDTPYYSGSDLKNLAVSAALTAVKEENEAKTAAEVAGKTYQYPERRTLTKMHFEKATGEIGASVSGDMSSLRQIKKFDEQFGDRKGRRKKNAWGFVREIEREADARVRG